MFKQVLLAWVLLAQVSAKDYTRKCSITESKPVWILNRQDEEGKKLPVLRLKNRKKAFKACQEFLDGRDDAKRIRPLRRNR